MNTLNQERTTQETRQAGRLEFNLAEVLGKVKDQRGVQARIIIGFQEYDSSLLTQTEIAIDEEDCRAYFTLAKAGRLDYAAYLKQIPSRGAKQEEASDREDWAKVNLAKLEDASQIDPALSLTIKQLIGRLAGFTGDEPGKVSHEEMLNLLATYGEGENKGADLLYLFKKLSKLAEKVEDKTTFAKAAEWVAASLHGTTRVEVLKQMGLLQNVADGDELEWKKATGEIVEKGKVLSANEAEAVKKTARADETEGETAEKPPEKTGPEAGGKDRFGFSKPGQAENQAPGKNMDRGGSYLDFDFVTEELIQERGRLLIVADGMTLSGDADEARKAIDEFARQYYTAGRSSSSLNQMIDAYDGLASKFGAMGTTLAAAVITPEGQLVPLSMGNTIISLRDAQGEEVFATRADAKIKMVEGQMVSETPGAGSDAHRLQKYHPVDIPLGGYVVIYTDGKPETVNIQKILAEGDTLQEKAAKIVGQPSGDDQFCIVAQV